MAWFTPARRRAACALSGVRRLWSAGAAGCAAALALLMVVGVLPAQAAMFNEAHGVSGRQRAILDSLGTMIDATPAGASIRLTTFWFTDAQTAQRLVAAARRGVSVQLIAEARRNTPELVSLQQALGTDLAAPSWARTCDAGCLGGTADGTAAMHSKFAAFSATGSAREVVVVSSGNLDGEQTYWGNNNALQIADPVIYQAFIDYFGDLTVGSTGLRQPDYFHEVSSGRYTVAFFPAPSGRDPVLRMLDKIGCTGGTTVTISMFQINSVEDARKLWDLDDAGCRVRLLYTRIDHYPVPEHRRGWPALTRPGGRHGGIEMINSRYHYSLNNGEVRRSYAHHKYVLINGDFEGRSGQKVVVTGSLNWGYGASRHNDEVMVTVRDPATYDQFAAAFDQHLQVLRTPFVGTCTALTAHYPRGLASPGARRPAGALTPTTAATAYHLNRRLDPDRDGVSCPVARTKLRTGAPREVALGETFKVTGRLRKAALATGAYSGWTGQPVALQLRAAGGSYTTIRTVRTGSDGVLRAEVRLNRPACYRWVYRGSVTAGPATAAGACVDRAAGT